MKIIFVFVLSLFSFGIYAQEESAVSKTSDNKYSFKSKDIVFDSENKTTTLHYDASYKDAIIEITGAKEIIVDHANNEVIATGPYNFTIDGEITFTSGKANRLRYKIGETKAYIE